MFRVGESPIRALGLLAAIAFSLIASPRAASAAELDVSDLFVSYTNQTPTSAEGTLSFTLRYAASGGDAGGYDLFSAQVLVSRMGLGAEGKFSLDESATEDTGAIGAGYWLPAPPTSFQNASTIGSEFRFTDFVSVAEDHVPSVGQVVARFVIAFAIEDATQFGTYQIAAGDAASNYFNSDFVNRFDNTISGTSFQIVPIPEPAGLLPLFGALLLLRRRR